jgi:twitching motility protein PilI
MNAPASLHAPVTVVTQASTASQTRIGFRIHPALPWLVLPTSVPAQLAVEPELAPVPNVKPWLVGVLNLRGNLVPVFDVARWQGVPAPAQVDALQVLVVTPGPQAMAVLVSESPALLAVRTSGSTPADDPLAAIAPHRYSAAEGIVYEFDPHAWLRGAGRHLPGRH